MYIYFMFISIDNSKNIYIYICVNRKNNTYSTRMETDGAAPKGQLGRGPEKPNM